MRKTFSRCCLLLTLPGLVAAAASAQPSQPLPISTWSWEQVKDRFELNNPTLLADKLNIDESKAQEITAFLRPNPSLTLTADGTQIAPERDVWRPFAGTYETPSVSYLHERRHKRELRLESAKKGICLRSRAMQIWRELCCSTCAAHLCQRCKPRRCCNWHETILPITTTCSKSAEIASAPATSRKSISTGWNCSGCSMNRMCRLRKSIFGQRKFSCAHC